MTRQNPAAKATTPYLNLETGETRLVEIARKPPVHDQAFTMLFNEALLAVLENDGRSEPSDEPFSKLDYRVLLFLVACTDFGNRQEWFVVEIARALGHDRSSVSRSLAKLQQRGLLKMHPQGYGRPFVFLLQPRLAFRGKSSQKAAALREHWRDADGPGALTRWSTPEPDLDIDPACEPEAATGE